MRKQPAITIYLVCGSVVEYITASCNNFVRCALSRYTLSLKAILHDEYTYSYTVLIA